MAEFAGARHVLGVTPLVLHLACADAQSRCRACVLALLCVYNVDVARTDAGVTMRSDDVCPRMEDHEQKRARERQ